MNEIELFNSFFNEQTDVNLISEFTSVDSLYRGIIEIRLENVNLNFIVEIPVYFPFSYNGFCIKFINSELIGFPHFGTYLCVHTSPTLNPKEKLLFELDGLKTWIKKYYIDKSTDNNYEYLLIPYKKISENGAIQNYFFQDIKFDLKKNDFGVFKYSHLANELFFIKEFGSI